MNAPSAVLFFGFLLLLPGAGAAAAAWSFDPTAELQAQYHSNLRLRVDDELDTGRSSMDLGLKVRGATNTTTMTGEFNWINLRYTDADFANSNDHRANMALRRRWARVELGLTGSAALENTLATEFDDTGVVEFGVQRERLIWGATATWQRTPAVVWGLSVTDERTGYEESPVYVDYRYSGASIFRQAALSSRTSLVARASYNAFDTDDGLTSSDTAGLSLGVEHASSETVSLRAFLGRTRTRSEEAFASIVGPVRIRSTERSWTADVGFRKDWKVTLLDFSAGQSIRPSGRGALTTRRYLDATLRHELSARSALRLSGELRQFEATDELTRVTEDREYRQFTLAFDHWLSSRLRLTTELTHRAQEFEPGDEVARGNIASVSLRYDAGRP